MDFVRHTDPSAFAARVTPFLMRDEARHNLLLGLIATLVERPAVYPEFFLWTVEDAGEPVAVALRTAPFNVVVSRSAIDKALEVLAAGLHEERAELPGVTAALPEVETFVTRWTERTGAAAHRHMGQRIYRLTEVRLVRGVSGRMREATLDDRELLLEWVAAFAGEAAHDDDPKRIATRIVDVRVRDADPTSGFALWLDEGPVSLVGWGGPTPNGNRIGPVYTPPQHRNKGYASALTAAVSAEQLARGRRFCFLYTDLANPTSNRIYQHVGYEPVCDSVDYRFDAPTSA